MAKINKIWAREILDSRGIPTIEVACQLDSGYIAVSSVPAGTSMGTYEALELRDNDEKRYGGKGVLKAVENINKILSPAIYGKDPTSQEEIDKIMIDLDGTSNKSKIGANAILAISEVIAKASAMINQQSLYSWIFTLSQRAGLQTALKIPIPIFNMINGGLHGAGNLDFQEFHIIPISSKSYSQGLQAGVEIYMAVGQVLKNKGEFQSVGHEGGYAPNLLTNSDALQVIVDAVKQTSYKMGRDVSLGLDISANNFYKNGSYVIRDKTSPLDDNALIEFYQNINSQYNLVILEDSFHENSWDSWAKITNLLSSQVVIVGDDLLVTQPIRVEKAIKEKACNGILIKPNQVGTLTETFKVIKMAKEVGWKIIVSHRSGETNDWFIADFAVGIGADYVKFGGPSRGERVAKYNRLSSIEKELS